jgi:hypothetical protein
MVIDTTPSLLMNVPDIAGFFPLVNKSDLFSTFVTFYFFVVTQFTSTIKTFQTNWGGDILALD